MHCLSDRYNTISKNILLLHIGEALAAIHRSVIGGLEGNLCFFSAVCAYCDEHFALGFVGALLVVAARLAPLGLVLEASLRVKFLLSGSENELRVAVLADKFFVLIHCFFSSLWFCDRFF